MHRPTRARSPRDAGAPDSSRSARAAAVFVDGNSALDLKDQALVIDYGASSELANVRGSLSRGYNGGAWNGLGGINSSTAAANPGYALGYAEAADVLTNLPTTWAGHQVDATSVLVRYTRYGDANLDRTVNLEDFNRLAERFGQTGTLWSQGNFNYDNTTNLNDFNLLAANFGQSVSALVDRATRPGDTPAEDDRV
jgi:hypothetical protein